MQGNPNYSRFREAKITTTIVNLAELAFNVRRDSTMEKAEEYVKKYSAFVTDIKIEDTLKATELKFNNRKLSLADAVGYSVAKRLGIKFLTGDPEFRHMKNVEFVR